MLAVISTRAIAVRMNSLRFEAVDFDLALVRIIIVPQNLAAETDRLGIEPNDLSGENFTLIIQSASLL
jgi:hypothetical protein